MKSENDEETFLKEYQSKSYPTPAVTVDLTIFTIIDTDLKILLIKRGAHPFKDHWALPGGFVQIGDLHSPPESLEEAALRELREETGLPTNNIFLQQLHTFGSVNRDPRMRVITVAYFSLIPSDLSTLIAAGSDATAAKWVSVSELQDIQPPYSFAIANKILAFDHAEIIQKAIDRIQFLITHTPIAFELVPNTFTISELRSVHEGIDGKSYDPSNFRRKFKRMLEDKIILLAPGKRSTASRPAKVYTYNR
jgi:8-oxo-dGTP diphosphatase